MTTWTAGETPCAGDYLVTFCRTGNPSIRWVERVASSAVCNDACRALAYIPVPRPYAVTHTPIETADDPDTPRASRWESSTDEQIHVRRPSSTVTVFVNASARTGQWVGSALYQGAYVVTRVNRASVEQCRRDTERATVEALRERRARLMQEIAEINSAIADLESLE
jgi:hypothetical protein